MTENALSLGREESAALKGVAICLMLWHHLFEGARALGGWTWWWGRHGNICVAMFLLLSGYGMAARYGAALTEGAFWKNTAACWAKRFRGLYLGFWSVFVLAVPMGVFCFGRGLGEAYGTAGLKTWARLAADFFAVGGYGSYNATWWFFRLIVACYLLYPFLQRGLGRMPWLWVLAPLLVVDAAWGWTGTFCREWVLSRWLFAFLAGGGIQRLGSRRSVARGGLGEWGLVALGALATVAGFWARETSGEWVDGFLAAGLAAFLVPMFRRASLVRAVAGFFGKHSMNIFMIHSFLCSYFFRDWFAGIGQPWGRFLALLGGSLALSMAVEGLKRAVAFLYGRTRA